MRLTMKYMPKSATNAISDSRAAASRHDCRAAPHASSSAKEFDFTRVLQQATSPGSPAYFIYAISGHAQARARASPPECHRRLADIAPDQMRSNSHITPVCLVTVRFFFEQELRRSLRRGCAAASARCPPAIADARFARSLLSRRDTRYLLRIGDLPPTKAHHFTAAQPATPRPAPATLNARRCLRHACNDYREY